MTKFVLSSSSVLTHGGNTISCVTSIDFDESLDVFISRCMALDTVQHIGGQNVITGTLNFEINTDDDTELGYLDPGTTGALVFDPAGTATGTLDISSTNMLISGRSMAYSTTSLTTGSAPFTCDDLTIGANV